MFSDATKSGCDLRGDIGLNLFVLAIKKKCQFGTEHMGTKELSGSGFNREGNITSLSLIGHIFVASDTLCWSQVGYRGVR